MSSNKLPLKIICEYCKKITYKKKTGGKRFCNRSCSNKWCHKNGKRNITGITKDNTSLRSFIKRYGKLNGTKRYAQFVDNMSKKTTGKNNPMHGRKRPDLIKMNKLNKGKTDVQRFGPEAASKLAKKRSINSAGKNNPMYGKPAPKGSGRGIKGYYKNQFFRSLLELVCFKHYESLGVDFAEIEHESIRIKYKGENNQDRTYVPDLFIPSRNLLIEVKPSRLTGTKNNINKFNAAKKYCKNNNIEFIIFTEQSTIIKRNDVMNDESVVLLKDKK
jgi:hypothetical protein